MRTSSCFCLSSAALSSPSFFGSMLSKNARAPTPYARAPCKHEYFSIRFDSIFLAWIHQRNARELETLGNNMFGKEFWVECRGFLCTANVPLREKQTLPFWKVKLIICTFKSRSALAYLAAATIFMDLVIFWMFLTDLRRIEMSLRVAKPRCCSPADREDTTSWRVAGPWRNILKCKILGGLTERAWEREKLNRNRNISRRLRRDIR